MRVPIPERDGGRGTFGVSGSPQPDVSADSSEGQSPRGSPTVVTLEEDTEDGRFGPTTRLTSGKDRFRRKEDPDGGSERKSAADAKSAESEETSVSAREELAEK